MRWVLVLAAMGCASGQMQTAVYNAQACEQQEAAVRADADRIRASSISGSDDIRAAQALAYADQISADCRAWRDQVALEQARTGRRRHAGEAFHGMANAYRSAGDTPPPPPTYRCSTDYIGGLICTPN